MVGGVDTVKLTPRRLRIAFLATVTAVLAGTVGLGGYLALRPMPARPATPYAAPEPVAQVSQIPPGNLLVVSVPDDSGSMRQSDPRNNRYTAQSEMFATIAAARPAPAKTEATVIHFGSDARVGPTIDVTAGHLPTDGFDGYLGDTDFAAALGAALTPVKAFFCDPRNRGGRALVVITTDGIPDVSGTEPGASSLWGPIKKSVASLEDEGAEIYLIGITDDSHSWRDAATRWQALLGDNHVLLANGVSNLRAQYRDFARTALDIDSSAGQLLGPGRSLKVAAGRYTAAFAVSAFAPEAGTRLVVRNRVDAASADIQLGMRGERAVTGVPAAFGQTLDISNIGTAAALVAVIPQTAVLSPYSISTPCEGAPIEGLFFSLRDGLARPVLSDSRDPLALSASLQRPGADSLPLEVREVSEGLYEARSAASRTWEHGTYRLTVLSRSVAGEIGRADYAVQPTSTVWPATKGATDLFALSDSKTVPLQVDVRGERGSAMASASVGTLLVAVQLSDLHDDQIYSAWLQPHRDGSFAGELPATVKDGIVRLTVVDAKGVTLSVREFPLRMRKSAFQLLVDRAEDVGLVVLLAVLCLSAGAGLWIASKPPIAGSLLVCDPRGTLQRFNVLGQKAGLVRLQGAGGAQRWLVLPAAARDSVRVLKVLPFPCAAVVRRGTDTLFCGYTLRLV